MKARFYYPQSLAENSMALCEKCGTSVSGQSCPSCGAQVAVSQDVAQDPTSPVEQCLFSESNIFISPSRLVATDRTYAISGITSVKTTLIEPSRGLPIIMIVLGVLFLVFGFTYLSQPASPSHPDGRVLVLVGVLLLLIGVVILKNLRPEYVGTFHLSSGEVENIARKDKELIVRLAAAINQAIVLRG
jgi:hypothetical protein